MKRYLGDAVYAESAPRRAVVLTTWNGLRDTNTIVLGASVLREFARWFGDARRLRENGPRPSKAPP